jgi:hypothetical protein
MIVRLTESKEAISKESPALHKIEQILAIASLSSPHLDANPFLPENDNVPDLPA